MKSPSEQTPSAGALVNAYQRFRHLLGDELCGKQLAQLCQGTSGTTFGPGSLGGVMAHHGPSSADGLERPLDLGPPLKLRDSYGGFLKFLEAQG